VKRKQTTQDADSSKPHWNIQSQEQNKLYRDRGSAMGLIEDIYQHIVVSADFFSRNLPSHGEVHVGSPSAGRCTQSDFQPAQ
jgi:hypothetical protein